MINCKDIDLQLLAATSRLVVSEAMRRGWTMETPYLGSPHFHITKPDGKKLHIFSATPPTTSFVAAHGANDKLLTTLLMKDNGIPVPETYMSADKQELLKHASHFFERSKAVVVKPIDQAHGHGVSVNVQTFESAGQAIERAMAFSEAVIIQEYISNPVDIRVLVINDTYVAALVRVPARVFGDGVSTIEQLIDKTNTDPKRGIKYRKPLNIIDKMLVGYYLGDNLSTVPDNGQEIRVLGTANVGTGGETIDVTDLLPLELREMSIRAAQFSGLPVCGVDFIIKQEPAEGVTIEELTPVFIEINKCPSLQLHETPTFGASRPAIKTYVDYLDTL